MINLNRIDIKKLQDKPFPEETILRILNVMSEYKVHEISPIERVIFESEVTNFLSLIVDYCNHNFLKNFQLYLQMEEKN
jgi:hypothetical protein